MEDINYILWGCQSAQSLWSGYLNLFRLCLDHSKDCFSIIEEAFEIRVWPFCKVFFFFFGHVVEYSAWEEKWDF